MWIDVSREEDLAGKIREVRLLDTPSSSMLKLIR